MRTGASIIVCGLVSLAACGREPEAPPKPPRPVSYVTLRSWAPDATTRLAGTVQPWKRVEIGFEIPGRVLHTADAGAEVRGATFDASGASVSAATVIATLDEDRYRIALAEREAMTASARANLKALETELELMIPQKLKAAQANLVLQRQEVKRYTTMVAEHSASQERLDHVEAGHKVAQAAVAEVESLQVAKAAQIVAARAQVRVTEEMIERARLNVEDCTLRAPFAGQIARMHVVPGGYVLPGQSVATVQMMDPIKVQVAVSPRLDAQLRYNDRVRVHLPGSDTVIEGYIYLKDSFADPATRTFLVTLLIRNRRIQDGTTGAVVDSSAPRASELLSLQKRDPDRPGMYFAEVGTLHEDESGFFVWKALGLTEPDLQEKFDRRIRVKKVRVTPGQSLLEFGELFTFRELADHGELDPERDLVLRGVTGDVKEGDEVLLVHERWLLRPGDIVTVGLSGVRNEPGYYVPEEAIRFDGQHHLVFVVEAGQDGRNAAVQVEVRVGATFGELQRIEAVADGKLSDGMQIVVAGAQYVVDDEAINPVEEVATTR